MKKRCEYLVAGLLIAAGIVHFAIYAQFMATSSLWVDEMTSILDYSSHGMWISWLDYSSNNHSFFNVIQAALNWQDPFDPLSARLISIIACSLIFPLVIIMCWSRGWVIESGVVLLILATNSTLLDWVLQGRGYGIQLLCGALLCHGLLVFYDGYQRQGLAMMLAAVVIGTWVIPSFVLFGGPVLLGLWLVERSAMCFRTGAFALALILGYYLPSFGLIAAEASAYGEAHGHYFNSVGAVVSSLQQWILPLPAAAIGLLGIAFIALPFISHLPIAARATSRIIVPSVCLFFVLCLLLGTPPTRVTLFVAVPMLLLLAVAAFSQLGREHCQRRALVGLLTLAIALAIWPGWRNISRAPEAPFENWLEAGAVLNQAFPDHIDVAVSFRGRLLDPYLGDNLRRIDFADRDAAGAVVDSNFLVELEDRLAGIPRRDYAVIIPQRRGWFVAILANYPEQSGVAAIRATSGSADPGPLLDSLPHTAWHLPQGQGGALNIVPEISQRLKALNWTQSDLSPVNTLVVVDGVELPAHRTQRYGNFVTADLRGLSAAEIQVALMPTTSSVSITQLWIVYEEATSLPASN